MIPLLLINLSSISQESYLKTDSICFSIPEAREIVRWNEERKSMKDINAVQYNKIKILEVRNNSIDTVYREAVIIRDTLIKEVEVYHEKYKALIKANQGLHNQNVHYKQKIKKKNTKILSFSLFSFLLGVLLQ